MAKTCPISTRRINSKIVRFISAQVAIFVAALAITKMPIFALILCIDFIARFFRVQKFSPFFILGQFASKILSLKPIFVDEAPKRFALVMGLVMSLVLLGTYGFGFYNFGVTVASIIFICALLETLFDYCVGCKIYYIIKKITKVKNR